MNSIKSINILVDNDSWILPYTDLLVDWAEKQGFTVNYCRSQDNLVTADVSFYLGCTKIVKPQKLALSFLNLVVHESDLPKGKGFAPVAWQILEGKKTIPVCLIEALENVDSGRIWLKDIIELSGHELCDEWRELQGQATIRVCQNFLNKYPELSPQSQLGEESFYFRRTPSDSELNPDKTIAEQFDLLRVVDNERYPAYVTLNGRKYYIKISECHE
ncbi:UDP-glucuronic acid dehydrogenase [Endozoicomonas sp. SCSIO W0465]|uniref:UDP-glucuronic acid dehydrogenase n=1 Tax=Endozoicomonas sp. SCSIO W0465 TaxID=2918516 RepID=UPI002075A53E|nr:UDP-glucuronic acid dehydrogenase [Endozoicomonas sp. SCSIO W0465]USE39411.1 UDP-glucuronic acid dehydrogenase [Endozoicomonas sp. SCSIO W0465]